MTINQTVYLNKWASLREKTGLQGSAYNTGTDQPAHPRSLISAFIFGFCLFECISKLPTGEFSSF